MDNKEQSQNIREYLKIKGIDENDKSEEMIEEIYNEVMGKEEKNKKEIWEFER